MLCGFIFHAFRHYAQLQVVGQVDNRANDTLVLTLLEHLLDEDLIDFQFIQRQSFQIGQR